jgi:addiction module HigA family antidote
MAGNEFAPVTPGEMLKEEFLTEYGLSQNQLAKAIGISPNRIAEIVNRRSFSRSISTTRSLLTHPTELIRLSPSA